MRIEWGQIEVVGVRPGSGDGHPILDAGGALLADPHDLARLAEGARYRSVPRRATVLPYDTQRSYDREPAPMTLRTVTVRDARTSATFLLDLGGRLWSLTVDGRELLHQSDPLMIGNLALRKAWFAGGTEWNLGFTGHWPLTCSPVFAGKVETSAGPVLRLWEYERMLGLVWRIDVAVRDGVLLVHPVIANHTGHEMPVYWWSNTAVPLSPDSRVLVPATDAWFFDGTAELDLVPVPGHSDVTRPGRLTGAADHFFRVAGDPWIAAVDAEGSGLGQRSTERLGGRKLFRWGEGSGGRRWQHWLGAGPDGAGYLEIQAGLAATQLEHLALPGGEVWQWTEAYGLVTVGSAAHGEWSHAVAVTAEAIETMCSSASLHAADQAFADACDTPAMVVATGSGWGALEVAAGGLDGPGTPFPASTITACQQPWLTLLRTGRLPEGDRMPPPVIGQDWRSHLTSASGWRERYLLALCEIADGRRDAAVDALRASIAEHESAPALRALASLAASDEERASLLLSAYRLDDSLTVLIEAVDALIAAKRPGDVLQIIEALDAETRQVPRVRLAEARAAVAAGDVARAADLLDDEQLVVPDLREGDDSLADLWAALQALTGSSQALPAAFDFGMHG